MSEKLIKGSLGEVQDVRLLVVRLIYLQVTQVWEKVEVADFLVAGHQTAGGDPGKGDRDVGK